MEKRKLFALFIACVLVLTIICSCGKNGENNVGANKPTTSSNDETKKETDSKVKFSLTSLDYVEGADYYNDEIIKTLREKFNFEYEAIPISWDNWREQTRIWVSSGDMPDVVFWDFNYTDYISYAKQGLIKPLPEDYESKYPNLAKAIEKTGVSDYLKVDGKLYCSPKTIYLNLPTKALISHPLLFYRKDWADKVGIHLGNMATIEEITNLAKAFIEQDPGGIGKGKTVGICDTPEYVAQIFVAPYNSYWDDFHKVDGKYIWGPAEPSTLEGVKALAKYYREGIIDKDFYTIKGKDYRPKFYAGKAGMMMDEASADNYNSKFVEFKKQNPDLDPDKAIGACFVIGPDGKYHGSELVNFWAASIFNPKLDDKTFDRILSIMDYQCTDEGQRLIQLGIEGKDYRREGDEIIITRPKQDNGEFVYTFDLYPSLRMFRNIQLLSDDFSLKDPSIPKYRRDFVIDMFKQKEENGNLKKVDLDLYFFSAPYFDKRPQTTDVVDGITKAVLSDNPEAEWTKWLQSMESRVNPVIDELNKAFAK